MAIVVRILPKGGEEGGEESGEKGKWECVNRIPHVTIGTRDDSVKPKESNELLNKWLQVGSGGMTGIGERVIEGKPVVKGSVRAVLSR